ncbi:MAG: inositol monophosphatase [Clostridia bacterium]|nr:inositol monophosphatase [Clostridia bacterium]
MKNLPAFTKKVIKITKRASRIMLGAFTVSEKDTHTNIVTTADLAVEAFLKKELTRLLPESAFLGEEGGAQSNKSEYLWVVDPIDGTMNFSRSIPESCVSVALVRGDEVILGVVYNPYQKRLYHAARGFGAYCNGKRIYASERPFENGILCSALCLYKKEHAKECMNIIGEAYQKCNDVRRFGSCALEICYLAEGKCDLFFEYRVFPWDYAAASLVLTEAGGVIFGENQEKLLCDKPTPIVAANNRESFNTLNEIVKKHVPVFPKEELLR